MRSLAQPLLLATAVLMASACVVPWNVERDEPPPNSAPIFDYDVCSPPLGSTVRLTSQQTWTFLIAARDADLGDVLTARLFGEKPDTPYFYFGQEFRLVLPMTPTAAAAQRRTGEPTAQLNYCALLGPGTLRVRVTDGTFSNQPGEQHKVSGGEVIEGDWRIECN
jgi:hypothetical protein